MTLWQLTNNANIKSHANTLMAVKRFAAVHFSLLAKLNSANPLFFLHTLVFSPSEPDTCLHVIEVPMGQITGQTDND